MFKVKEICSYIASNKFGWILEDDVIKEENTKILQKILTINEVNFKNNNYDITDDLSTSVYDDFVKENCSEQYNIFIEICNCLRKARTKNGKEKLKTPEVPKTEDSNNNQTIKNNINHIDASTNITENSKEAKEAPLRPAERPPKPPSPVRITDQKEEDSVQNEVKKENDVEVETVEVKVKPAPSLAAPSPAPKPPAPRAVPSKLQDLSMCFLTKFVSSLRGETHR